jgi:hypothetical protein
MRSSSRLVVCVTTAVFCLTLITAGGKPAGRNVIQTPQTSTHSRPAEADRAGALFYAVGTAGAALGTSVADVGDVNGDGFPDVLAGAPGDGNGRVYLFYGNAAGTFGSPDWSVEGTQTAAAGTRSPHFGAAVAGAGDLNGDGFADFVVGAPDYDYYELQTFRGTLGTVFIYLGSTQGPLLSGHLGLGAPTTGFGYRVARGGDIDGDGRGDFLASMHLALFGDPPRVWASYAGGSPVLLYFGDRASNFGDAIAGGCDIDGDGYDDVVVGASGAATVSIFNGTPQGINETPPTLVLTGGAHFGQAVACSGDVNHDGFDDVAIGDDTGVSVRLGSAAGLATTPTWTMLSPQPGSSFGASLAWAGDMNGDGYSDLIVGASTFNAGYAGQGAVFVYGGGPGGLSTIPILAAAPVQQGGAQFGAAVSGAGDYDGDGLAEVMVGAPAFDPGIAPGAGRVDLLHYGQQCQDSDADGVSDCVDDCPFNVNPGQEDADGDGIGDACDNCPTLPNADQNPCACGACYPTTVTISFSSPAGKGGGLISWTTGIEHDLAGFNVVLMDNGIRVQENAVPIPCNECTSGVGASYAFPIAKHKNGRNFFVEQIHLDGHVDTFGPAVRQ